LKEPKKGVFQEPISFFGGEVPSSQEEEMHLDYQDLDSLENTWKRMSGPSEGMLSRESVPIGLREASMLSRESVPIGLREASMLLDMRNIPSASQIEAEYMLRQSDN